MKYYLFLLITSGAFVCMNFEKSVWAGDMMNFYPPANMEMQNAKLIPPSDTDFQKLPSDPKDSWRDSSQYNYGKFKETDVSEGKEMEDIYPPQ